jgi:hypothetical protein
MTTKQIIDKFVSSVDLTASYSISDLVKLLKESHKNAKTHTASGEVKPKKAPSAYNLFIKEQMAKLKDDGCNPTERMKRATEIWKEEKAKKAKEADDADKE